jgi:hypothetical protein
MENAFSFFVAPHKFTVRFHNTNEGAMLLLYAEDQETYHAWSTAITNNFSGSNSSGIISKVNPNLVRDILAEYHDKTLDESKIQIIFPTAVLCGEDLPIIFEFKALVYKSSISDRIAINLEFAETSWEDRLNKKIMANNLRTEERVAQMETRMGALEDLLERVANRNAETMRKIIDGGIQKISENQ